LEGWNHNVFFQRIETNAILTSPFMGASLILSKAGLHLRRGISRGNSFNTFFFFLPTLHDDGAALF